MPLHDWTERSEWEGMHIYWMTEIAQWLKARLPAGYRAVIGSSPYGSASLSPEPSASISSDALQPDYETVVATLKEEPMLLIERNHSLVAAVEIISPGNKDRPARREQYLARYLGYLHAGVHLLLIDVHRRPLEFSFAERIRMELQIEIAPPPTPQAVSYQVRSSAPFGGRFLAAWQRACVIGELLPSIPLPISAEQLIPVDLEATYMEAAKKAYVEG